ncbi:MAG: UvrD-helicase domain-containing protein [Lachnospiraceae bacterium]|nr:UvrD-helicase domain-containing protein [Lachnospiraceae bacterium]
MGISFTEKQQRVIDVRGRNVLVSAAAGSGKTAVLVERIVKMVSDSAHPVDIDRLLVVTFTNAAAAEMRERISRALNDRLAADPENEHLQRQAALLHNARITTIDSFCLFVLRNQFHTIGLDPAFRIAEEGEVKLLRQEVLAEVLEDCYKQERPEFINCIEYFSVGSRDTAVEDIVLKLYDFAMSTPFPEVWLEERKQDYRIMSGQQTAGRNGVDEADSTQTAERGKEAECNTAAERGKALAFEDIPWVAELLRQTKFLLAGCVTELTEAVRLCEEPDGPYMYGELLEREREMTERLLRLCDGTSDGESSSLEEYHSREGQSRYEALYAAFNGLRFDRLPSKKDDTVSPVKRELAKNLRTQVKERLGDLQKKYFFKEKEQIFRQMEACGTAVEALADLTLAFKEAFDRKKRDKNLLDFNDIEHFALQILVRADEAGVCFPTETALEYRSYFHEILIDEYQDSNLVQEYILSCISGEDEGRYNRFMVGDVKQSIYKFRLARPELFLEKYEAYGSQEHAQTEPDGNGRSEQAETESDRNERQSDAGMEAERIDLHQNFRSRFEVLNTTNAVFEQIMGKDVGGIVYDDLAALHMGAVYPVRPETDANLTELLLFRTDDKPEDLSAKEQEAYGIAAKIRTMMREFTVTDRGSGALRALSYRDIVILMRTTAGWDEVFKRVLESEGIPVHMTSRTGYFAASEVQELLHFLRVLDNPLQDIPLYGVMHSYLGGFSEEEIALIRAAYPKKRYLYDAVRGYVQSDIEEAQGKKLIDKIRSFLDRISRYRSLSAYLSVQELLQTILRETDYLNYVAVKPEGNKRRANVEMLMVKAADYEKTSFFGLYHFLRYMDQLEKYEVDYGEAGLQDENADVVRIMSIHKSKGLEFPVCFVAGLAKGFQTRDISGRLVLDIDDGIGVDYVNPTERVRGKDLRKNVIAEKMRVDNLAEEMRILYVAMTRAAEKLILTGTLKSPEKTVLSLLPIRNRKEKTMPYGVLLGTGSYLELVLAALAGNRCMDELYRECGVEPDSDGLFYDRDMSIRVELSGWEDRVEEKLEEAVRLEEAKRRLLLSDASRDADVSLMTYMADRFAYRYPHENLRDLYTKTTVSELKMAGMQEETDFSFKLYEEETVVPYLPGFLKQEEHVSGSARGSAFHKVMELFDFTRLTKEVNKDKKAAEALLRAQLEEMRGGGRLSEEYYKVISVPKIVSFLTSGSAARMGVAARSGRLYKEQPFVMGLPANRLNGDFPQKETVLIQGIIDVFFEEDGKYVLLDYKTDAVETAEQLAKRYHVQLDYYAEALEQSSGYRDTEKILYSFKLGEEIYL